MERLTVDTNILFCDIAQCREVPGGTFCKDGYCDQRRVYERLREYERKGLAPEDAPSWTERAKVYSAIRRLKQYEALGTIDDLTALAKARDEGRVVVLPCKVGDTVYYVLDNCNLDCKQMFDKKGGIDYWRRETNPTCIMCDQRHVFGCEFQASMCFDVGKTVFLTRAEAEAALKGGAECTGRKLH